MLSKGALRQEVSHRLLGGFVVAHFSNEGSAVLAHPNASADVTKGYLAPVADIDAICRSQSADLSPIAIRIDILTLRVWNRTQLRLHNAVERTPFAIGAPTRSIYRLMAQCPSAFPTKARACLYC